MKYLVTMEDDHGMWLDSPEGYDTAQQAETFAGKLANRFKRAATVYRCEFVADVEPGQAAETKADAP